MKLAEALNLRADLKKRIAQLDTRLKNNAKTQEGDKPAEDPTALLEELEACTAQLQDLAARINKTNCAAPATAPTLTELLAQRDALTQHISILRGFLDEASAKTDRYSNKEIRVISTVDVPALRKLVDEKSRALRELDSRIQMLNWETELL